MGFYIGMFICNLLMPLLMIIGGYWMYKKPPGDINGLVGYRTTMSRKNKDTWAFAHDYCGKLWLRAGVILLVPSIIVQIPFSHADDNTVGILTGMIETVQLIILLGSIFFVERALKRTFDENGNRKNERDEKEWFMK